MTPGRPHPLLGYQHLVLVFQKAFLQQHYGIGLPTLHSPRAAFLEALRLIPWVDCLAFGASCLALWVRLS
jgi:hypothetical protein